MWYEFEHLAPKSQPGLIHGMVTRLGGVSLGPFASLNLGGTVGDAPEAVAENHRRLYEAFGVTADRVVSPYQVHGAGVALVGPEHGGSTIPGTDALITAQPGLALLLHFADCVPVLLYDPTHHVLGLAHAGWRGVAAGVVPDTVSAMGHHFGSQPGELWAGIGPAIGPDHYAVGKEVVDAVLRRLDTDESGTCPDGARAGEAIAFVRDGQWHLDLAGAVASQLRRAGVSQLALAGVCTACHTEEWYSHRGEKGRTGRFGVIAMLA